MAESYPSMEQVNAASHYQICAWWRFLNGPGLIALGRDDFEQVLDREVKIMERIGARLKEYGGFTPEISKSLGWK